MKGGIYFPPFKIRAKSSIDKNIKLSNFFVTKVMTNSILFCSNNPRYLVNRIMSDFEDDPLSVFGETFLKDEDVFHHMMEYMRNNKHSNREAVREAFKAMDLTMFIEGTEKYKFESLVDEFVKDESAKEALGNCFRSYCEKNWKELLAAELMNGKYLLKDAGYMGKCVFVPFEMGSEFPAYNTIKNVAELGDILEVVSDDITNNSYFTITAEKENAPYLTVRVVSEHYPMGTSYAMIPWDRLEEARKEPDIAAKLEAKTE